MEKTLDVSSPIEVAYEEYDFDEPLKPEEIRRYRGGIIDGITYEIAVQRQGERSFLMIQDEEDDTSVRELVGMVFRDGRGGIRNEDGSFVVMGIEPFTGVQITIPNPESGLNTVGLHHDGDPRIFATSLMVL
jgi:hypothetical protein